MECSFTIPDISDDHRCRRHRVTRFIIVCIYVPSITIYLYIFFFMNGNIDNTWRAYCCVTPRDSIYCCIVRTIAFRFFFHVDRENDSVNRGGRNMSSLPCIPLYNKTRTRKNKYYTRDKYLIFPPNARFHNISAFSVFLFLLLLLFVVRR